MTRADADLPEPGDTRERRDTEQPPRLDLRAHPRHLALRERELCRLLIEQARTVVEASQRYSRYLALPPHLLVVLISPQVGWRHVETWAGRR